MLKHHYKVNLDVDAPVVEYLAVYDILKLCAEGRSNKSIAYILDFDEQYITEVLVQFFKFCGHEQDLDFDTRSLYSRNKYNEYVYVLNARDKDHVTDPKVFKTVYKINCILDKIEAVIEKGYK